VFHDRFHDRLTELEREYDTVQAQLNDPTLSSDPRRLRDVSRRHRELEEVVGTWQRVRRTESDLEVAREMVNDSSGHERELAQAEVTQAEQDLARLG